MTRKTAARPAAPSMADLDAIRLACTRVLGGHGNRTTAEQLAAISADTVEDHYGEGGVVADFEREVAELLGKPAAVFMPSGTMTQQIALRVHADRRNRRTVLWHPHCHLAGHELDAHERLHGLHGRTVGRRNHLITIDDLRSQSGGAPPVAEAPAALLLELPQRDLGGQLPAWDDLVAQVDWAHAVGAAAHMDGARLWMCGGFYDRSFAEIAGPFDTVYVSFYKDIGALAGAALAGPEDAIAEAREWRLRHGGRQWTMWPHAASALAGLRLRLPRMPAYRAKALELATALDGLAGATVLPAPPQTSMFHVFFDRDTVAMQAAALRMAREDGTWTWGQFAETNVAGISKAELSVGDAALTWTPVEFRTAMERLLRDR